LLKLKPSVLNEGFSGLKVVVNVDSVVYFFSLLFYSFLDWQQGVFVVVSIETGRYQFEFCVSW